MNSRYNEYDSIFGNVLNGGSMAAPVQGKTEPIVPAAQKAETRQTVDSPKRQVHAAPVKKADSMPENLPLMPTPRSKKKTEPSVAMIRDFPRPILNTIKAMFPAGNQTDALVAFALHALGGHCSHGGYEAPPHIREMVEAADKGTLPGLKAEMTGIGGKLDKLYTGVLMVQFLNVYAMLHDVGVRKRTEGLSQVDMLEDKMFEAIEIIRRDFPEFRQIVEDREHRNTSYFRQK